MCEDVRCGSSCFAPRLPQRKPGGLLLLTPKEANCPRRGCARLRPCVPVSMSFAACEVCGVRAAASSLLVSHSSQPGTVPSSDLALGVFLDVTVEPARAQCLECQPTKTQAPTLRWQSTPLRTTLLELCMWTAVCQVSGQGFAAGGSQN